MYSPSPSRNASSSPHDAGGQPTAASKFKFRLWHLFYVTTVFACSLSIAGWWGILLAVVVIGIAVWLATGLSGKEYAVAGIVLLFFGSAILFPAENDSRGRGGSRPLITTAKNMRNIQQALVMYHDANGRFPPPYIADKNGKPMHSWRVLILPYLELQPLYDAYRFDEPWDGPNNRKLIVQMPRVFQIPAEAANPLGKTHVVAVVGDKTIWSQPNASSDDPSWRKVSTIALPNKSVCWTEPSDLSLAEFRELCRNATGKDFFVAGTPSSIFDDHPPRVGGYVALADGNPSALPYPIYLGTGITEYLGLTPDDRPPPVAYKPVFRGKLTAAWLLSFLIILPYLLQFATRKFPALFRHLYTLGKV